MFIDRVPVLYDINWTINPGENWPCSAATARASPLLRLLAGDESGHGARSCANCPAGRRVVDRLEVAQRRPGLVSDRRQATYTYDITGEELVFSGIDNSVGVYREPSRRNWHR